MNTTMIQELIEKEKALKEELQKAEANYKAESLKIRCQIGVMIADERRRSGLGAEKMAIMLECNRQKVFASECPDKVPNPFSVAVLLEMLEGVSKVADLCEENGVAKVRSGRPSKFEPTKEG